MGCDHSRNEKIMSLLDDVERAAVMHYGPVELMSNIAEQSGSEEGSILGRAGREGYWQTWEKLMLLSAELRAM